jgi:hypothetical protein
LTLPTVSNFELIQIVIEMAELDPRAVYIGTTTASMFGNSAMAAQIA